MTGSWYPLGVVPDSLLFPVGVLPPEGGSDRELILHGRSIFAFNLDAVVGVYGGPFLMAFDPLSSDRSEPDQPDQKGTTMAKSLDTERAAVEAEERPLVERRKAHGCCLASQVLRGLFPPVGPSGRRRITGRGGRLSSVGSQVAAGTAPMSMNA